MRRRDFIKIFAGAAVPLMSAPKRDTQPVSLRYRIAPSGHLLPENPTTSDLVARFKRNAAACAASISPPENNDPLYYMTGQAAAEIELLQAENGRLRSTLVEIGRLATEEGANHLVRLVAQVLEHQREQHD